MDLTFLRVVATVSAVMLTQTPISMRAHEARNGFHGPSKTYNIRDIRSSGYSSTTRAIAGHHKSIYPNLVHTSMYGMNTASERVCPR